MELFYVSVQKGMEILLDFTYITWGIPFPFFRMELFYVSVQKGMEIVLDFTYIT